jgi:hypothetical protein
MRYSAPAKVWFDPDAKGSTADPACVFGETVDLSRCGLSIVVPSIRLKEKYLVGQDRDLNIELDLPAGKVLMKGVGRRYEIVGMHVSTERFLVGIEIVTISDADLDIYESVLNGSPRPLERAAVKLELGID